MNQKLLSRNLAYSWWTHPLAVQMGDLWFCGVTSTGAWRIFRNDKDHYTELSPGFEADDHNAPSIVTAAGKESVVFYTRHHLSPIVQYRRTSGKGLNFGIEQSLTFPDNVTYTQAVQSGDNIILFTRAGLDRWYFVTSPDYGVTWTKPVCFLEHSLGSQCYLLLTESETTSGLYHIALTPNPNLSNNQDITYGTLDISTGDISNYAGALGNLDGTNLPLAETSFDGLGIVQDSQQRFRLLDVGDKYGQTAVYYAKWLTSSATPYYYQAVQEANGTWTRTALNIEAPVFGYSGAGNYVGGIALDRNNANYLYMSQKGAGGTWSINRYPINSDFTLGTREILVTHATKPLVRPYAVNGTDSVLYQELQSYSSYTSYSSHLYLLEEA